MPLVVLQQIVLVLEMQSSSATAANTSAGNATVSATAVKYQQPNTSAGNAAVSATAANTSNGNAAVSATADKHQCWECCSQCYSSQTPVLGMLQPVLQ